MAAIKIDTSAPKVDRDISVTFDFGSDLSEMRKLFGDRIVYEHAFDNMRIALQGFVRSRMERTGDKWMTDAAIKAAVKNSFVPGGRVVDPTKRVERVQKDFAKLDDRAKAKLFREWQKTADKTPRLVKTPKPAADGVQPQAEAPKAEPQAE